MIPYVNAENLRAIPVGETRLFLGEPKAITMLQSRSKEQAEVWTVTQELVTIVFGTAGKAQRGVLVRKLSQYPNPNYHPQKRGRKPYAKWKMEAAEIERKVREQST